MKKKSHIYVRKKRKKNHNRGQQNNQFYSVTCTYISINCVIFCKISHILHNKTKYDEI